MQKATERRHRNSHARKWLPIAAAFRGFLVLALTGGGGCGSSGVIRSTPTVVTPDLNVDLVELVPEGADFIGDVSVAEALRSPPLGQIIRAVASDESLAVFGQRNGLEPNQLEHLVYADFGDGRFIVLVQGGFSSAEVMAAVSARMNSIEVRQDTPFVRVRGFLGTSVYDVAALNTETLVVAHGRVGIEMGALLERASTGSFPNGNVASLQGHDGLALREAAGRAPVAIYFPQPLDLPLGHDVSILFARERAFVLFAVPVSPEQLSVRFHLLGEFPPGAIANFRGLVRSISDSELGAALGISEAMDTLRIQQDDVHASIRLSLRARSLARGLHLLFAADARDLLSNTSEVPSEGVDLD